MAPHQFGSTQGITAYNRSERRTHHRIGPPQGLRSPTLSNQQKQARLAGGCPQPSLEKSLWEPNGKKPFRSRHWVLFKGGLNESVRSVLDFHMKSTTEERFGSLVLFRFSFVGFLAKIENAFSALASYVTPSTAKYQTSPRGRFR